MADHVALAGSPEETGRMTIAPLAQGTLDQHARRLEQPVGRTQSLASRTARRC
jgi:hypothetical protein